MAAREMRVLEPCQCVVAARPRGIPRRSAGNCSGGGGVLRGSHEAAEIHLRHEWRANFGVVRHEWRDLA